MAFIRMWSPINQQLILRFINANIVIIYDLSPKLSENHLQMIHFKQKMRLKILRNL